MADQTVKFVQLVENYQCLYNNTLQEYSRKDMTEKAWSAIARELQWSVADCKEKWKNIRNGFVRSLKPSPSGSSSKGKKPYYLHDIMQFVLPYVKPVQHSHDTGNISLSECNTETMTQPDEEEFPSNENVFEKNTEPDTNEIAVEPRKRTQETFPRVGKTIKKRNTREETDDVDKSILQYIKEKKDNKTPDDDKKMFLLSLLPDVNNLSERNLRQFKIKTLMLLEELLTQQDQPTNQHFQMSGSLQVSQKPPHCYSSRSSSLSSLTNTVGTPAPSPISSAFSPIIYNSNEHVNAVKNLGNIPPRTNFSTINDMYFTEHEHDIGISFRK